jgi:rRNA maturation protein Nop10
MNGRVPIIVLVDVRCRVGSCICQRTVPGRFKGRGRYAYPANQQTCPECGHLYEKHEVIGVTRRLSVHDRLQKQRAAANVKKEMTKGSDYLVKEA